MAVNNIGSRWQQAIVLTSLLANISDFAAVDKSVPMATPSLTSYAPQFTVPSTADIGASLLPNVKDPNATLAQVACPGYIATQIDMEPSGFTARLRILGEACNVYGIDVEDLDLTVEYQTKSRLHVHITPSYTTAQNASWYELPEAWVPAPPQEDGSPDNSELEFSWNNDHRTGFGFNVTRKSNQEIIFSTTGSKLVYENQFIEFVTSLEDDYNLYGLGESIHGLRQEPGVVRTIYAADAGDPIDGNIYGSHPFYLQTVYGEIEADANGLRPARNESASHGVYMRNVHGMEVLMHPNNVTWRALGGEIDLYFFAGPTQPEVTSQYLHAIGLPAMQQYWTFGYHQCRWGYQNWSMTEEVVDTLADFEIPLETIWNDIDYMNQYRDFTNDANTFSVEDGQALLQRLHDRGQHYVPIVDAAIYIPNPENASDAYQVFNDGYETGSFLLNPDGSLYIGAVWPGYTVFPDWLTPSAPAWWQSTISNWYKNISFSGLWIDMNEASSFCVGSCGSHNVSINPVHPSFQLPGEPGNIIYNYPEGFNKTNITEALSAQSASSTQYAATVTGVSMPSNTIYLKSTPTPGRRNVDHPPYVMNHIHGDLAIHAVAPNATHHSGVQQYDVHNLYGHQLLQNTYSAISAVMPGKRPFIIGRSTFVGSGNYSGHWGGDNYSKFLYMYFSIPQALSFSLFGMPMFGADVCGFAGNSDEELCNRWMQLGAFFPFYRNHNVLSAVSQEPYVWNSVAKATKVAMNIRFQLLPYLYTLFHYAHSKGDTVMRALAWEFPNDPDLANADRQFFLGPAILVTPVLTQGHVAVDGVFPGLVEGREIYYDWYNQSAIGIPSRKNTTIDAPLGHIPVHIRGGHLLATQPMKMTTREARKSEWSLIVAPNKAGYAAGRLYLDDGESIHPEAEKLVSFKAQVAVSEDQTGKNVTRVRIDAFVTGEFADQDLPLVNVTVLGASAPPDDDRVRINGKEVFSHIEYDAVRQRISISSLEGVLDGKAWAKTFSFVL